MERCKAAETAKKQDAAPPAGTPAAAAAAPADGAPAVQVAQQAEFPVFENDLYRVKFSNKGAVVMEWELKKFKDADNKLLNLVNGENATQLGSRPLPVCRKYDPRFATAARILISLIHAGDPSLIAYHVRRTSVAKCAGKGVIDLH